MEKKTHIAIIPSPGFSHLVPIIEFSKRLIHLHPHFHITCVIPSLGSPPSSSQSYLQSLPPNIHSIFLPPIPTQKIPQNSQPGLQIQLTVTLSLPHILKELKSLTSKCDLLALVADIFAHEALDFAAEFNLKSYIYFPLSAMLLSLLFHSTNLDEKIHSSLEFKHVQEPFEIPGCVVPLHGRDFPNSLQDRKNLAYKQFLERSRRFPLFDGILVNSFQELETETIRVLREKKTRIYMVGPIIQNGSDSDSDDCLNWLNNQSSKSVLYVSFGSGGTLCQEQINELAFGLEQSGKKFLWVLRSPSEVSSAAYLNNALNEKKKNPLDFLPKGFLERTEEQGLVVPWWAPQISILKHDSVGGFLSHCGWNSTLESVVNGVPLMTWPLFAEQRTNSVLLCDGLKVALWPKGKESGIVEREEVSEIVRKLMDGEEGKEIRKRMEVLKDAAANTLKEDGSSTKDLCMFAMDLRDCVGANFEISEKENVQG